MFKSLRNLVVTISGITLLLSPALVPAMAYAQSTDISGNLCSGSKLNLSGTDQTCASDTTANSKLSTILQTVINIFSVIVGAISVIMIIVGGLKYIISGGESGNVSGAKNTIIYALIGLVIVALAQVIVHFVLSKLGG